MGDLDIHFRRLLRAQVQDFLRMAFPALHIEAIGPPIDPSVDRSRKLTADNLFHIRHAGGDSVVHIEVERDWRPSIPRRLFEYGAAAMTETQAPVASLVVLLRPGGAPPETVGTYRVPGIEGDSVVFAFTCSPCGNSTPAP